MAGERERESERARARECTSCNRAHVEGKQGDSPLETGAMERGRERVCVVGGRWAGRTFYEGMYCMCCSDLAGGIIRPAPPPLSHSSPPSASRGAEAGGCLPGVPAGLLFSSHPPPPKDSRGLGSKYRLIVDSMSPAPGYWLRASVS